MKNFERKYRTDRSTPIIRKSVLRKTIEEKKIFCCKNNIRSSESKIQKKKQFLRTETKCSHNSVKL